MLLDVARQPRGDVPAGIYHVTVRSAGPIAMFVDTTDRMDFCGRLSRTKHMYEWRCIAFCLMTTHYHLLVEVGTNALQPAMHRLNGQYAQEFNRAHARSGHLRGDRYSADPVATESHLLAAFRYIVRNPVRAGICRRPGDWPWSSYRGTAGFDPYFAFVDDALIRDYFGGATEKALQLLRDFAEVS
jgi:REP element-mobilizing transposase RayT